MKVGSTLSAAERRAQIYTMRKAGNSWEDIAETFGLREQTCKQYVSMAIKQDGLPEFVSVPVQSNALEVENPALATEVLVASMEPLVNERTEAVRQACKAANMEPRMIAGLLRRMKSRYKPVVEEGRRFSVGEMIPMLESKTLLVLSYMDELVVSEASGKDLAYMLNILIEKHQLLNNRPTQIVDATTHMQLPALVTAVVEEARRRGVALPELKLAERVDGPL